MSKVKAVKETFKKVTGVFPFVGSKKKAPSNKKTSEFVSRRMQTPKPKRLAEELGISVEKLKKAFAKARDAKSKPKKPTPFKRKPMNEIKGVRPLSRVNVKKKS
jgi:hypothetical protein